VPWPQDQAGRAGAILSLLEFSERGKKNPARINRRGSSVKFCQLFYGVIVTCGAVATGLLVNNEPRVTVTMIL